MAGFFKNMWPEGGQGFGAAMGEAYPLLLSMGAAMQAGKSPFAGAQTGLAQMMAMDANDEDKRRWEAEMELRRAANARAEAAASRAAAAHGRAGGARARQEALLQEGADLTQGFFESLYAPQAAAPSGPTMGAAAGTDAAARNAVLGAAGGPTMGAAAALGYDSIQGGQGDDLLFGGQGSDMISGGAAPLSPMAQAIADMGPVTEGRMGEVFGANPIAAASPDDEAKRLSGVAQQARRAAMQPQPQKPRIDPQRATQILMHPGVPAEVKKMVWEQINPGATQWERYEAADGSVWVYDPRDPGNQKMLSGAAQAAPGFRPASPEEAAKYGAEAGQIDTKTGRFYPGQAGQGFMMTLPDGTQVAQGNLAGVKFTEGQAKDNVYATRANGALAVLEPVAEALLDRGDRAAEMVPFGLARGVQAPDFQVAQQAGEEFLQAILRKDTGAAITSQEQEMYGRTYLPQPGDGPEVLEAKRQARHRAVAAIESGMSPLQQAVKDQALIQAANDAKASRPDAPALKRQPRQAPQVEAPEQLPPLFLQSVPNGEDPVDLWNWMTAEERRAFE